MAIVARFISTLGDHAVLDTENREWEKPKKGPNMKLSLGGGVECVLCALRFKVHVSQRGNLDFATRSHPCLTVIVFDIWGGMCVTCT